MDIKNYILRHKEFIETDNYKDLYANLFQEDRPKLTKILLEADVNFLSYVSYVPGFCFYNIQDNSKIKVPEILPNNIREIGPWSFAHTDITRMVLNKNCAAIYDSAFRYCENLTEIYIPKTMRLIGNEVFKLSPIKDIYYEGTDQEWKEIGIMQREDLEAKSVTIHYNSRW